MMRRREGTKALLEEALAAHEAFRRLDVAPDEIFFSVGHEGASDRDPLALFITVKTKKGFEFNYVCGPVKDDKEAQALYDAWPIAARVWNSDSDPAMAAERERIWRESNIGNSVAELAMAWTVKKLRAGGLWG